VAGQGNNNALQRFLDLAANDAEDDWDSDEMDEDIEDGLFGPFD